MALGEKEKSLEWLRKALELDPEDGMLLYNAGCIYAMAGLKDAAIDALDRSVAAGLNQIAWFEKDSNLDPLREDQRFKALLARMAGGG